MKISVISGQKNIKFMKDKKFWEVVAKVIVAALTAALTAVTTTSCMGYGPING